MPFQEDFLFGHTLDSQLTYKTANDVNWETYISIAEICGDYDDIFGANIEGMEALKEDSIESNLLDPVECVDFDYIVDADDDTVTTLPVNRR